MRKVFIADAHLRAPGDDNYQKLLRFLDELRGNTEALFVMGDLFEFWIGYRNPPFTHYFAILEQLRQLVESGTQLVYFEGNHDFHMGPFFREKLRARVYRGPAVLELDGQRVYLCHGDQINGRDWGYYFLRFLLHNPLAGMAVPVVPVKLVTRVADRMGRMSRQGHVQRRVRWDYMAILRSFAAKRFSNGCDAVIAGHFHIPLLEKTGHNGRHTLLSLGDWITHFTYGEMVDGKITLKKYEPPQ